MTYTEQKISGRLWAVANLPPGPLRRQLQKELSFLELWDAQIAALRSWSDTTNSDAQAVIAFPIKVEVS